MVYRINYISNKTQKSNIDHVYGYTESISSQLDDIFDNYIIVENATTKELSDVGTLLGTPIMQEIDVTFDPLFTELEEFQDQLEEIYQMLIQSDIELSILKTGVNSFQDRLMTLKNDIVMVEKNLSSSIFYSKNKNFWPKMELAIYHFATVALTVIAEGCRSSQNN